jgi:ABC-type transport system involved in cytochrome c biogenesis permease subunit
VDPSLLRGQFALALFILLLALLILPFQDRGSGAFVVTILAGMVALVFIGVIALAARWSVPRLPKKEDKGRR